MLGVAAAVQTVYEVDARTLTVKVRQGKPFCTSAPQALLVKKEQKGAFQARAHPNSMM